MGRNRKPKAVHELSGTFEKHPERKAAFANEPKPKGPLGDPPKSFDPEGFTGSRLLEIWNEIVSQAPPGVLTSSDRLHVEVTCRIIYRIRYGTAKSGDFSSVKEFLGKMAMNPADRPKVQLGGGAAPAVTNGAEETGQANTFEQLAEEGRQQGRVQ
jgi:hypothetical protein